MNGSPSGSGPPPGEDSPVAVDLARTPPDRNAGPPERPRRRRGRRIGVGVLVALSCLLILLSTLVVWTHRTVLNTDQFVGTVGPVFSHPEVDAAVATRVTDQLFTELNIEARLRAGLPPKAKVAAAPVTNSAKNFVTGELTKVLASPTFQSIWIGTLRVTHEQLVAVLRGQQTGALSTSGGYIVLNTVPAINQALGKVSGLASDLTGKQVTLPTITSADPPQKAVDKLSTALGVQLPSNFGQITLVKSDKLAAVQRGVRAFDRLTLILPLVTILLIALTLWLSVNRRRTLLQMAVVVSLLMIVLRRVFIHEQGVLAGSAHNPEAAQAVLGTLLNGFFVLTAWILGVALAIVVITVLCGPYRWAVAMRARVARTWHSISAAGRDDHRGVVAWMASHAAALQLGGAVVAGILLLVVSVSWVSFLIIGVLLAAYEVYLQWIKPSPPDEPPPAAGRQPRIGET